MIANLGRKPSSLKAIDYSKKTVAISSHHGSSPIAVKRELVGVDIYLYSHESVDTLQKKLSDLPTPPLVLTMITNRGVRVWPEGIPETTCIDHWRCRFVSNGPLKLQSVASLFHRLADGGLEIIKTENLYTYDGQPGYSS